jgi:hypothetical protein
MNFTVGSSAAPHLDVWAKRGDAREPKKIAAATDAVRGSVKL